MLKGNRFKKGVLMLALLLLSAGSIVACGGGGGGGGGGTSAPAQQTSVLSAANAPQAASSAMDSMSMVMGVPGALGSAIQPAKLFLVPAGAAAGQSVVATQPVLRALVARALSASRNATQDSAAADGSVSEPVACTTSGQLMVSGSWTGPNPPVTASQISNGTFNITAASCAEGGVTMNGSMEITFQGPLSAPTSLTISAPSLTFSDSLDSLVMSSLTLAVTNIVEGASGLTDLTSATIIMNGSIRGTVSGTSVFLDANNFTIAFSTDVGGDETLTVSGTVEPSCLSGSITYSTPTAIYVPSGATCPSSGEVLVSSGGNTTEVLFSNGQAGVYFNGALTNSYASCTSIQGLCMPQ